MFMELQIFSFLISEKNFLEYVLSVRLHTCTFRYSSLSDSGHGEHIPKIVNNTLIVII
jgi:hypothetical protein